MTEKIFVCDLDGVLLDSNTTYAQMWTEILGKEVFPNDFVHWQLDLSLGVDPAYLDRFWTEVWQLEEKPYPDAGEFVHNVKNLGYKFVVLTSRGTLAAKRAAHRDIYKVDFNGKYEIDDVVICDQEIERKSNYINNLDSVDFFLDDHVKNAVDVKIHCPQVREVMLFNQLWNKSADLCGYVRVYSYHGVLARLLQES